MENGIPVMVDCQDGSQQEARLPPETAHPSTHERRMALFRQMRLLDAEQAAINAEEYEAEGDSEGAAVWRAKADALRSGDDAAGDAAHRAWVTWTAKRHLIRGTEPDDYPGSAPEIRAEIARLRAEHQ